MLTTFFFTFSFPPLKIKIVMVTRNTLLLKRFRNVSLAHISYNDNHFFNFFYSLFIFFCRLSRNCSSIFQKIDKIVRESRQHHTLLLNGFRCRNFQQFPHGPHIKRDGAKPVPHSFLSNSAFPYSTASDDSAFSVSDSVDPLSR